MIISLIQGVLVVVVIMAPAALPPANHPMQQDRHHLPPPSLAVLPPKKRGVLVVPMMIRTLSPIRKTLLLKIGEQHYLLIDYISLLMDRERRRE